MKKEQPQQPVEQRDIRFRSLVYEALPEMWSFELPAMILVAVPAAILRALISLVAEATGAALTTANLRMLLLSWCTPIILLLGTLLVLWYIVVELFAKIHMSGDILSGRRVGLRRELAAGIRSVRRFLTPTGFWVLLYIFLAVPLCGVGFSISLTEADRAVIFYRIVSSFVVLVGGYLNAVVLLCGATLSRDRVYTTKSEIRRKLT